MERLIFPAIGALVLVAAIVAIVVTKRRQRATAGAGDGAGEDAGDFRLGRVLLIGAVGGALVAAYFAWKMIPVQESSLVGTVLARSELPARDGAPDSISLTVDVPGHGTLPVSLPRLAVERIAVGDRVHALVVETGAGPQLQLVWPVRGDRPRDRPR